MDQMQAGLSDAVDQGITASNAKPEIPEAELTEVKKLTDEYTEARGFDEYARKQYNADRKYAQGIADPSWASDANIIGAFIDILVSFLYAQNPDVSTRPAAQAGGNSDQQRQLFAETLQIVVSRLWKEAKLKKAMRRTVRAVLSIGVGWFKAIMYSETKRNVQVEKQLADARDNVAQIEAIKTQLAENGEHTDEYDAKITELNRLMQGLEGQVEILVKRGMCIDFCRSEDIQVSLDVADTEEYLSSDWISNDMYIRKTAVAARFPAITEDNLKAATIYYQRQTGAGNPHASDSANPEHSAEGQFTKQNSPQTQKEGGKPIEFVKVVELWDHRDDLVKTFIEGAKQWAVEPYAPPQASTRFYPYFRVSFFETDGSRHPQSLSWRLKKLQDEYSGARSAGVLTRRRSIPGTIFNKGQLDPVEVRKLENSEHLEMVGIDITDPTMRLDQVITAKPVPRVDPMLFDTMACQRDMEVLSGVQEAQQQAVTTQKTATEAEIQQSGFRARTGADRDNVEDVINELALYTSELALQSLTAEQVQRIAGPLAFWPEGMNVQDILTLVEVEIQAGTTGKPQQKADKEAWATLLPLIQQMILQIQQLDLTNPPAAMAQRNLLKETLRRLDDRLNIDSIIPPPPPQIPGLPPGAVPPQAPGALPGEAPGAPPVGNGTINNPAAQQTAAPPP
jgi:hypothetical protein